jgi:cupin 2 domain-containing protein
MNNLLSSIPVSLPHEIHQDLLTAPGCRVERIVSRGHASPPGSWYDQDRGEWVLVLEGAARLEFDDESIEMQRGDFVDIPAHKRHRVAWTTPNEPTIWLTIHYG